MEAIRAPHVIKSLKKAIPVVPTPSGGDKNMIDQLKQALNRRRINIQGSSENN
jgi:hypothetical protein